MSDSNNTNESEYIALSAALSVHYIVMFLYAIVMLLCLGITFMSFMSSSDMGLAMAIITLIPLTLFSIHLLAVKGLKREKQWGHRTSKVLAMLLLMGFPFGTVLGVILLSQLSKFRFSKNTPA